MIWNQNHLTLYEDKKKPSFHFELTSENLTVETDVKRLSMYRIYTENNFTPPFRTTIQCLQFVKSL